MQKGEPLKLTDIEFTATEKEAFCLLLQSKKSWNIESGLKKLFAEPPEGALSLEISTSACRSSKVRETAQTLYTMESPIVRCPVCTHCVPEQTLRAFDKCVACVVSEQLEVARGKTPCSGSKFCDCTLPSAHCQLCYANLPVVTSAMKAKYPDWDPTELHESCYLSINEAMESWNDPLDAT